MKLLILASDYAPKTGGVEKHVLEVVRRLRERGWEIDVLVRYRPEYPRHQVVEGVEVWRLPRSWSLPALAWWCLTHLWVIWGIKAVHSHDIYPRHLRKFLPKTRWVHTFHGYEGWPLDPGAIRSRQIIREEVGTCFGVGAFIETWYKTKLDYVIYGAASLPTAGQTAVDGGQVLFIGRLEADTGFEDYLKGFALIHKRHPEVKLTVLGEGSLRGWAEEFIANEQLPAELKGWVSETAPYLRAARAVFVSGYLAILEAALMEKPVVAHYGTPIKHDYLTCHPLAGHLSIVGNPEEVAAGYEKALQLPATVLAEAKAWAGKQSWDALADAYEKTYTA